MNKTMMEPTNLREAMDFAELISKSPMIPKDFIGKPQNVLVAIQWGYEIGLAPMQALQNIAVINGKPSIYGDAMLALVKMHPKFLGIEETLEGQTAKCKVKRLMSDGSVEETIASFSLAEAQTAGLTDRTDGPWKKYPNRMLQMRARGFALRDSFPDALKGMITAEEAQDYPTKDIPKEAVVPPSISQDGSMCIPQQSSDTEEVIEVEVEEEAEIEGSFALYSLQDDQHPELFKTQDEWVQAYLKKLDAGRNSKKYSPADRRTKLKEFQEKNQETLDSIDPEKAGICMARRLDFNKALSVEEKEAVREDGSDAKTA